MDAERNKTGSVIAGQGTSCSFRSSQGIFHINEVYGYLLATSSNNAYGNYLLQFDTSRVVPTGNANKVRAWGALACVYLGVPK